MDKSLRFVLINKGDSDLHSRVDQINQVISKYKPHILVVNELNMKSTDTVSIYLFDNYTMEADNLDIVDQMARTGVLIQKDIHYWIAGFVRATHTWLASQLLSTLRSTLRPLRSLALTSQSGLRPPSTPLHSTPLHSTPINHSSTHTSAYGLGRDGRVIHNHSALDQLCGSVPPKFSKSCTNCVKVSARDSKPLFNMIAHLGHPGAREYVQVLAVVFVSSGNPGAMESTLYSSSLFNLIVHLVITGAREIVKTTIVNSVAPGIPDAMEPTLNSSFFGRHLEWRPTISPTTSSSSSSSSSISSNSTTTGQILGRLFFRRPLT